MKWYKFRKIESGNLIVKVKPVFKWDKVSPEIDDVVFTNDFHLIITFRDGTVKDIDAQIFINDRELQYFYEELKDNIELFQNPYSVSECAIIWTDKADVFSDYLWDIGKTVKKKTSSFEKIAAPAIITLDCGLTLRKRSNEGKHKNTPHYHLYHGDELAGVVAVNGPNKKIDKYDPKYAREYKEAKEYIYANKPLLIEIYNAPDGALIDELAAKLPKG